jgi:chromate transporter
VIQAAIHDDSVANPEREQGSVPEVFLAFLRLGCISFGGPIAHLGYFQKDLIVQRRWCGEDTYAEIIALAQSLPGPSSSQVCFALGVLRAGWLGGLAAWFAFALPSALLMFAFAFGAAHFNGPLAARLIHGLQLVAVAIVAQAIMTMQRSLAPDRKRMLLALAALAIIFFVPSHFATFGAILTGAIAGLFLFRTIAMPPGHTFLLRPSRWVAGFCAVTFLGLLVLLPFASQFTHAPALQVASIFYTSGALVFGGGHVVLPLLQNALVTSGWVSQAVFLSGYGAAQALPGPLFSFGGFLGASIPRTSHRALYGLIGLFALSGPGLLAMAAILPFWQGWRTLRGVQSALRGVNAAVVGVLIAAFFAPLWTSTVHSSADFWVALCAFVLLTQWNIQPVFVVCITVALALTGLLG